MKQEFVPYQLALELKQLGFDEPCIKYYTDNGKLYNENLYKISAPLYQQAFRWFRDKHELSSWVYNSYMDKYFYTILQNGRIVKANESVTTYEKAELACLTRLIEIIKANKK